MRLSAWVSKHGVATFTLDDFIFVGSKVSTDPSRLVLVGGQALETWGIVLDVLAPTGDRHPLTEDTDWLGSKRDAQWLCDQLGSGVELQFPGGNDHGPSTGLAFLQRPDGRVLMMDFLRTIVGPTPEEVRSFAVQIEVQGIRLNVLHPLLCLHSRLSNIAVLASKRSGNGRMQAEWSIDIATAWIKKVLAEQGARPATRACHKVAELAASPHARYCYLNFDIDPTRAITPELISQIGGRFETEDWPGKLAWLRKRQARWKELASRAQSHVPLKASVPKATS
jgi:hypothetical protein